MGTYPLRLADHLMEEAKSAAAEDNVSLNQLLATFIADGIGHRRAVLDLKRRAARANPQAALEILARAPKVAPDPGDEVPASTGTRRRAR
jgi:pyruvate/2-oxoglutarate dehydrogenase complex dihydrolipoamide acyltransferase (E2) component